MNRKDFIQHLFGSGFSEAAPQKIASSGVAPYSGAWTEKQVRHLLRRTGFGAPKHLVDQLLPLGMTAAVNNVLTSTPLPPPPVNYYASPADADGVTYGTTWVNQSPTANVALTNPPRVESYIGWWGKHILNSGPSIHEKMVIFWHNHFATNNNNMFAAWLYKQNMTFRQYALGNVKTLTKEISKDPCMLEFLNGNLNSKTAPDENYARELQELFTVGKALGVNGYTEDDVKAAARVLTGYRINYLSPSGYYFNAAEHDITTKNFSAFYNNTVIAGQSGAAGENELDQLLNMIFAQSETAKHIVRRLYMFFVYYKIDAGVESNVIEPLAQELISNNFEILPVLQTLFKSEHFYDMAHMSCHIKSPYDFAMGFIRELEAPMPANEPDLQMALYKLNLFTGQMGMELHNIQQVAGWIAYYQTPGFHENWINASTLSARIDFSKQFLNGLNYGGPANLKLDILSFVSTFTNPSDPNALVQEACTRLYSYDISQNGRDFLKSFLLAGGPGADSYWVAAWDNYVINPTDPAAINAVETRLKSMFEVMFSQSEFQIS